MYGAGSDGKVYKQTLTTLDQGTWSLAGNGQVTSIAIDGDAIYGTGNDGQVYKQVLSIMSPATQWQLATGPSVKSVAITTQADPGRLYVWISLGAFTAAVSRRCFDMTCSDP